MAWSVKHKRNLRVLELVLLIAAIIGPWGFGRINVPAQYPCSAPFVRLDGDFCGHPLSGAFLLGAFILGFFSTVASLASGTADLSGSIYQMLSGLFALLLVLPLFSSLALILRGEQRLVFHLAVWSLALGTVLLGVITSQPKQFLVLWGPTLYAGLAAGVLILETIMLAAGYKQLA